MVGTENADRDVLTHTSQPVAVRYKYEIKTANGGNSLDYDLIVVVPGDDLATKVSERENSQAAAGIPSLPYQWVRVALSSVVHAGAVLSQLGRPWPSTGGVERVHGEMHAFGPLFSYSTRPTNNLVHTCIHGPHL